MRHASIALHSASCTSCMLCVRECPDWCITVTAHTEDDPNAPGYSNARRPSQTKVLDSFSIDFGHCMWCGICVEVCPFDALFWSGAELPEPSERAALVLHRDQLEALLPEAVRPDGSAAPQPGDPPSGRRKRQ